MRKCKICGEEKDLELFRKRNIWRSHTCKKCYSSKYVSGKENTGRFKKGMSPWIKGRKGVKKREHPRYLKKGRTPKSEHRLAILANTWSQKVKERDEHMCKICGSTDQITAHHIVPLKEDKELRFDVENGKTLCRKCHSTVERYLEMSKGKFNLPVLRTDKIESK